MLKAPQREYDKRLEFVLKGEMNKDIIILGSSRGASNVLAGQLEKETGLKTYNLSYEGSNVLFHNFILKTLLKYNKSPKKIIIVFDLPYQFIEEKSLIFRADRLYPLSKSNYINEQLIKHEKKNWISWFFMLARLNKVHLEFNNKNPFRYNPIDSLGSRPYIIKKDTKNPEYLSTITKYDSALELPEKIEAFTNIQKLCSENNIELIVVIPPNFKKYNSSFTKRIKKLLLQDNRLYVYDTLNPIYKNEDYFNDSSHLFKNGAKIFTSEISTFINQNKDSLK
ncbi:hypothetical protein LY08_00767 [Olleya aquimaris]|uniref:SGNH/GDSL hydrolase family protein n=2 Tax=Olleya aquimaris TaxID=639310 RepID=A0A327RJ93_9FLAO|nr:hypothetical protein LY08_00767 [Olleya aquimaris]